MSKLYVIERTFSDGGHGEVVGPFSSIDDATRYAALAYPKLPCVTAAEPRPADRSKGYLTVIGLTEPKVTFAKYMTR